MFKATQSVRLKEVHTDTPWIRLREIDFFSVAGFTAALHIRPILRAETVRFSVESEFLSECTKLVRRSRMKFVSQGNEREERVKKAVFCFVIRVYL